MRVSLGRLLVLVGSLVGTVCFGQGHDPKPAESMKELGFLVGDWRGTQVFNTPGSALSGKAVNLIRPAIEGKYLEEKLSTTMPGRSASDTRHFITFNSRLGRFQAWWFNDASIGAMQLDGVIHGKTLVLQSVNTVEGAPVFRAIYDGIAPEKLKFTLELKSGDSWRTVFVTSYAKRD
jgi:hypothetical protein